MFDMIGTGPICVQADWERQDSICEFHALPDSLRQTSGRIEVLFKIFALIRGRGNMG